MNISDVIMLLVFWGVAFFIAAIRTSEGSAFMAYTILTAACFAVGVKEFLIHYM
jgi:hypothetical protein